MGIQISAGKGGTVSEMNVVPLIDVLLVLIIIFMVITPLTPHGLDAMVPQIPEGKFGRVPEEQTVVVQVAANGGLRINQEETSWEALGSRIEHIFKTRAQKVAFVQGENETRFENVARAIDIMRASGVKQLGLLGDKLAARD